MQFSRFVTFGALGSFQGGRPLAEQIYDALWANLNGNGAVANYQGKGAGGYTDAKLYATSMALARWVATSRRLVKQIDPDTVLELLVQRESQFGVVVPYGASLTERRLALRVAMQAPGSGTFGDIYQALTDLLGSAFVDLRRLPAGSQVTKPDTPALGPGVFWVPNGRRREFKLLANVTSSAQMNALAPVAYVNLDDSPVDAVDQLQPGERFVLEPGHNVLQDKVTPLAVSTPGGQAAFTAYLKHPHHAGATLTTMPWPYLYSTGCRWIVQLTDAASLDPETRRQVHRLLRKVTRGFETWDLVGSASPFLLDSSPLDTSLLG